MEIDTNERLRCVRFLHRIYKDFSLRELRRTLENYDNIKKMWQNDNAGLSANFALLFSEDFSGLFNEMDEELLNWVIKNWNMNPYIAKRIVEKMKDEEKLNVETPHARYLNFLSSFFAEKIRENQRLILQYTDEFLVQTPISEDVIKNVIMPFIISKDAPMTEEEEKMRISPEFQFFHVLEVTKVLSRNDALVTVERDCANLYILARMSEYPVRASDYFSDDFVQEDLELLKEVCAALGIVPNQYFLYTFLEPRMQLGKPKKSPKKPKKSKAKMSCARSSR